ncbi:MAG: cell division protein FtsZ [Deltaproteobacteria bacterium RIFOXYD12_FULL_55_16]|nr:MAG: cell division protein FtsZ [Deltaproteobacteria bacterium RIFOXYD12_FULL_55_16]
MTFKFAETESRAKIRVFGVGGGGGNAVNTMVDSKILGVEFIAGNTDSHALEHSRADIRLQLGKSLAKGLGAGANPEVGRAAAEESIDDIRKVLKDSDMVFVTAGLGGGTGTGAAPVVARIAKELGALTVGVVTKPFAFEGRPRSKNADSGWKQLKEHVDAIITIPNDRLLSMTQKGTRFIDGMKMADDVLVQAVKGITDLINLPGYINPDFADVKTIMTEMGPALMGSGYGVGENRAVEAVNMAINSPLLQDISIAGAKGVLVNISSSRDSLRMPEVSDVTTKIYQEVHEDANIILGVIFDENLGDELQVTVIATGIRETMDEVEEFTGRIPVIRKTHEPVTPPVQLRKVEQGMGRGRAVANGITRTFSDYNMRNEQKYDRPTFLRRNES